MERTKVDRSEARSMAARLRSPSKGVYRVRNHKRTLSSILTSVVGILLLFGVPIVVAGQTTADIVGTVTDATGAIVSDARVTLTNLATGVMQQTKTNSGGDYLFTLLLNGKYSVKVEAAGFRSFLISSVPLEAGARQRVDVHLEIGERTDTVTVTTEPPAVQTDTSSTGTTLTEKPVEDLPLNGRNFVNLIELAAGMNNGQSGTINSGTRPDDRRQTSSYVANAQDPSANNNMLDGMDNNERLVATLGVRPSIDSISEVQVLTGNYSAEVARTGGGAVNVITKGGTNKFHGAAYEFIRNDVLDARDVLAVNGRKPELRQNQFGGSIGGPIKKNKLFFFGDYEGLRAIQGVTGEKAVPTAYEEEHPGDFSDVTFASSDGTKVPGPVITPTDTAGLNYFKLYPTPNINLTGEAGSYNYTNTVNTAQYQHVADGRIDYAFPNSDTLFGRYTYNDTTTDSPSFFPSVNVAGVTGLQPGGGDIGDPFYYDGISKEKIGNLLVTYSHPITQNLVSEVKGGYTRINISTYQANYGENAGNDLGIPNSNFSLESSGLPFVTSTYAGLGGPLCLPIVYLDNTFQYSGSLTYAFNKQTIKAGATVIRRQIKNEQSCLGSGWIFFESFNGPESSTYPFWAPVSLMNMLNGTTFLRQRFIEMSPPQYRSWEPGFYGQDDWHICQWLTLNLGLRYDIFTPYTEIKNHISNFDPKATNVYGGQGAMIVAGQNGVSDTAGLTTDHSNVAPRIGFAASIWRNTVLRGGWGISFFPTNYESPYDLKNAPFVSTFIDHKTFSTPYPNATPNSAVYPSGSISSAVARNYRSAYLEQMNLTLQHDFHGNVLTATYVGLLGRHLPYGYNSGYNLDQAPPNALGNTLEAQKLRPLFGDTSTDIGLYCGVDSNDVPLTPEACATSPTGVGTISYQESGATSSFSSLQTTFERRLQNGLGWNVNYTWEHALGDVDGTHIVPSQIAKLDRGNSSNEIEDRIVASINYELPFAKTSSRLTKALLQGWQANTIVVWNTGLPFTVTNGTDIANTDPGNSVEDRPNQVGKWRLSNSSPTKGFFNTSAFAAQTAGTVGTERENQLYGPHFRHWDLSAFKNFKPTERLTAEFRAEFFNITNTPNWGLPDSVLTDANFGKVSSTAGYETPRQIQFALKLLF